jgi:hypothetical protein
MQPDSTRMLHPEKEGRHDELPIKRFVLLVSNKVRRDRKTSQTTRSERSSIEPILASSVRKFQDGT